jgi:CubicO group peptidase (beta-lactamase class C family)
VSLPAGLTLANWDLGGEPSAWAYLHAGDLFPHVEIPVGSAAAPLLATSAEPPAVADLLDRQVSTEPVSGIVVVHHGQIIFQRYPRMRPDDRHLLMSVSKVFASTLIGILSSRGLVDVSQPASGVIPELGPGWTGVRIADVLAMASGIDCHEIDSPGAYTEPAHPFYRFEASLGWRPAGSVRSTYDLVAALPRARTPGQVYEYTSVNTFVLSWLVERLTGESYAAALGREIWSRAGFEAPALLCTSATGAPVSHGGICLTLRDLARFGLLFTPSAGVVAVEPVIDAALLNRIQTGGRPELHPADGQPPASWQWNRAWPDGDLFKSGFGGQGLYVSPARDLVIVYAGVPRADGTTHQLGSTIREVAALFPA